jgi:hypothetical protein
MKKSILITLCSFVLALSVNAQISKGSVFLGGSLFFTHTSDYSGPGFGISPQIGTVYNENSIVGISLNYANSDPSTGYNFKNYGGGLFLRKYRQLGKNFYFFGDARLSYLFSKTTTTSNFIDIQTTKQSTYSLSIYPGISYSVSRKFHIDVTINNLLYISYNKTNTNYSSPGNSLDTKSNTFFLSANNQISYPFTLGFNFIL